MTALNARYGKLTILSECEPDDRGRRRVLVDCDCGAKGLKKVVEYVRRGDTTSCGCVKRNALGDRRRTHGAKSGGKTDPTYTVWQSMKDRCSNPNNQNWAEYGGRGIKVCDDWVTSFVAFREHVGERPSLRHTIDRIDVNGHYEPGNVRWATQREQMRNTRRTRFIEHDGRKLCLRAWAEETGIAYDTLRDRLNNGWPVALALTTPTRAAWGTGHSPERARLSLDLPMSSTARGVNGLGTTGLQ